MTRPVPPEIRDYFSYDPATGDLRRIKRAVTGSHPDDIGRPIGWISTEGYRIIRFKRTCYPAHRVAWFLVTGKNPKEAIDHINCDRADNRWINLREATVAENNRNRPPRSPLGKGVRANKGRGKPYSAIIGVGGKHIHLGMFDTIDQARAAYAAAASKYHGDFARTV